MTRRPLATVRILHQLHLAPDAVRVEIDCRYSTTRLTSIPSEALRLTVPKLVTAACYEHEARCGQCSTEQAHQQGDQGIRDYTERVWEAAQAWLARHYGEGEAQLMTVEAPLCDCDRCLPVPADDQAQNDKARIPTFRDRRDTGRAGD